MTPLELSESDATIWSVTLELSITILEASFAQIYEVYVFDDCNMFIVQAIAELCNLTHFAECFCADCLFLVQK
jgi:hypothetical protein